MKQKDITLIAVVVIISGFVSYIACNKFIPNTKPKTEKAEVVDAIVSTFKVPDGTYFNAQSVNPSQLIQIGQSENTNPFIN